MISRLLASVVLATCATAGVALAAGPPPPVDAGGVTGLDLQTQLEKGLEARRPVEFEYIDQIIRLVEEDKLPRKLVTTTFTWARKKPVKKLQYFAFALDVRARGLPVKLPPISMMAVGTAASGGQHGVNTPPIPARLAPNF